MGAERPSPTRPSYYTRGALKRGVGAERPSPTHPSYYTRGALKTMGGYVVASPPHFYYSLNFLKLFSKNRPLADSFIESQCPSFYLSIYISVPFSCNLFACNQTGSSIGHACNQTALSIGHASIGHASILLHAWSLKNEGWVQSVHQPRVHRPRVHLITRLEPLSKEWVQSVHRPRVHQPRVHLITRVEP